MKRIIFGGSFDPIHRGHFLMAKRAKEELNADIVEFVIAPSSRWKKMNASEEHRLNMMKKALHGIPWAHVSTVELKKKSKTNYTFDTLEILKSKHPKDEFFLLIGSDQANQFDKWYKPDEIAALAQIAVYLREDYPLGVDNKKRFRMRVIKGEAFDVSSSAIRSLASLDTKEEVVDYLREDYPLNEENKKRFRMRVIKGETFNVSSSAIRSLNSLDTKEEVVDYIVKNRLYFMKDVSKFIGEKRISHSFEVAKLARKIAVSNNLDPTKAFVAGLLHDIGKEVAPNRQTAIMNKYYPEYVHLYRWIHHQFLGEYIAKTTFNITDKDLLTAIKFHATGTTDMSPLAMILYSADKIEPTRGFDSRDLIEACLKDYESGFIIVLQANKEFLLSKKLDINNELTKACMEQYLD